MSNLEFLRPLLRLIPEVEASNKKISFQERAGLTVMLVLVFMSLSHLKVYGAASTSTAAAADPFYHMRLMMAASRGSLLELGIAPIMTSAVVINILTSAKVVVVNFTVREERALVQGAQMLLSLILSLAMALVYVASGLYRGSMEGSGDGASTALLVFIQLFGASVLVTFFDQIIQKGYGIGSGVSLFVATTTATHLLYSLIGFPSIASSTGLQYPGLLLATPQLLFTRSNKLSAIYEVFFRSEGGLNGIIALAVSVAVVGVVVFLQNFRVEVAVKYQKYRSGAAGGKFPIRLMYTGNMPLVLLSVLIANIYFYSQVLQAFLPSNPLTHVVGSWAYTATTTTTTAPTPTGGLAYYISAPQSVLSSLLDPFHTLLYVMFILAMTALMAKMWVEVAGLSSKGVARELKDQQMVIKGHRDTALEHELNRYIPIATTLGGMSLGALVVVCDLCGIVALSFPLLTTVPIIYQYYEMVAREFGGDMAKMMDMK